MVTSDFFIHPNDCSLVKRDIVTTYFGTWANIISRTRGADNGMAYVDLYSGPGRYQDGTSCTSLVVVEKAIADPVLCARLRIYLNDVDASAVERLRDELQHLPGIERLNYPPQLSCFDASTTSAIVLYKHLGAVPTFSFLDPFGYKGITTELINTAISSWGSDAFFLFNYNRINQAIDRRIQIEPLYRIFGQSRAELLRSLLDQCSPSQRITYVLEQLCMALQEENEPRYILPFMITSPTSNRPSHHLIFISKHPLGYERMKEIMAKRSTSYEQGVASYAYNPATKDQPFLFSFTKRFDQLVHDLLIAFDGRALSVEQVFKEHNLNTPYILSNYKAALLELESKGMVQVDRPPTRRIRNGVVTLGNDRIVTFKPIEHT